MPLLASASLHVDTPDETEARAILDRFVAAEGLEVSRVGWEPYPKLGPHSRLNFVVTVPDDPDAAAAAIDEIVTAVVGPALAAAGHVLDDAGKGWRSYERIVQRRETAFALAEAHWLQIVFDSRQGAQRQLKGYAASLPPRGDGAIGLRGDGSA